MQNYHGSKSLSHLLPILVLIFTCNACSSNNFRWREKSYEFPEEALRDQKAELETHLQALTPCLEEQSLGGTALIVLPNIERVRASEAFGSSPDAEGFQYFEIQKMRNNTEANAKATQVANLFQSSEITQSESPAATELQGKTWLLIATPINKKRAIAWTIKHKNGQAQVDCKPSNSVTTTTLQNFVSAVSMAGQQAKNQQSNSTTKLTGWHPVKFSYSTLSELSMQFPTDPEISPPTSNGNFSTWSKKLEFTNLQYQILVKSSAAENIKPGLESNLRDQTVSANDSYLVVDQDQVMSQSLSDKWLILQPKTSEQVIVVRIIRNKNWLVCASVRGARTDLFVNAIDKQRPVIEQIKPSAKAYLTSIVIKSL